jgi:hypothetical protein
MHELDGPSDSAERAIALRKLFPDAGYYDDVQEAVANGDSRTVAELFRKQFSLIQGQDNCARFLRGYQELFPQIAAHDSWYRAQVKAGSASEIISLDEHPSKRERGLVRLAHSAGLRKRLKLEARVGRRYAVTRDDRDHVEAIQDALDALGRRDREESSVPSPLRGPLGGRLGEEKIGYELGSIGRSRHDRRKSIRQAAKSTQDSKECVNSKAVERGCERAKLVGKLIGELNALRPHMEVPEDDYPVLKKQHPKYRVFKICEKHPAAAKFVHLVRDRRSVHSLAFEIAAIECQVRPATIKSAWKKYKPKQFRQKAD